MSNLTQRLYLAWLAQNGAIGQRNPPGGGMGGVPPMEARQGPAKPSRRGHPAPPAKDAPSRPEKRYSHISR